MSELGSLPLADTVHARAGPKRRELPWLGALGYNLHDHTYTQTTRRREGKETGIVQGHEGGLAGRAGQRSGGPAPSPEDVEADVALEVNVGVINHRLTLHLGGVMRVTLAHLAPGEERAGG